MKKITFLVFLVMIFSLFPLTAQDQPEQKSSWKGLFRLNLFDIIADVVAPSGSMAVPFIDIVPHISPEVGIPINLDLGFSQRGGYGWGLETGIEVTPTSLAPGGFFFSAEGGVAYQNLPPGSSSYLGYNFYQVQGFSFYQGVARLSIGYQFLSNGGFVFTPAVGPAVYFLPSGSWSIGPHFVLDFGFAYK